jgi:hypothetical protein
MKGRRSPAQRRARKHTAIAIAALVAVALLIVVLIVTVVVRSAFSPDLDSVTLCPTDREPSSHWAVILDATDTFNPAQRTWIEAQFQNLRREVPEHGELSLFTVPTESFEALRPVLTLCNPGTAEGVSPVTGNPALIRRRWETGFDAPLDSVLGELLDRPASRASPILETIQAVNIASLKHREPARKLFIFSDLLQHTDDYSHYGSAAPSFDAFRRSRGYRRVQTDLSDWDVTVFYARRDDALARPVQGRSHIEFWDEYITAMGGRLVQVQWIEG